jgi:hypothetical protein
LSAYKRLPIGCFIGIRSALSGDYSDVVIGARVKYGLQVFGLEFAFNKYDKIVWATHYSVEIPEGSRLRRSSKVPLKAIGMLPKSKRRSHFFAIGSVFNAANVAQQRAGSVFEGGIMIAFKVLPASRIMIRIILRHRRRVERNRGDEYALIVWACGHRKLQNY